MSRNGLDVTEQPTEPVWCAECDARIAARGFRVSGAWVCSRRCLDKRSKAMTDALGWWTLSGEALMDALHRVKNGDDPDVVYAELYANSDHEDYREQT